MVVAPMLAWMPTDDLGTQMSDKRRAHAAALTKSLYARCISSGVADFETPNTSKGVREDIVDTGIWHGGVRGILEVHR